MRQNINLPAREIPTAYPQEKIRPPFAPQHPSDGSTERKTEYVFSNQHGHKERDRLRLLERTFDDRTKSIILDTGLSHGGYCLEIGPGAGSILTWMGEVVGDQGLAVGLDKNTEHIQHLSHPPINVVAGMLQDVEFEHTFDLIHTRYVLVHNSNPGAMIAKLARLLKPGGFMVLEEPDFTIAKWIDSRYKTSGDRVFHAFLELLKAKDLNPAYGSELAIDMMKYGLDVVHIDPAMHLAMGGSDVAVLYGDSMDVLRSQFIESETCTESELDDYVRGSQDPRSLAHYATTISTVARKPA